MIKKIILFILKVFLVLFVSFGGLFVYISLEKKDAFMTCFFLVWMFIGFLPLVLLVKKRKPDNLDDAESPFPSEDVSDPQNDVEIDSEDIVNETLTSVENDIASFVQNIPHSVSVDESSVSSFDSSNGNIHSPEPVPSFTHRKFETHYVAGTSYRQKEIQTLGEENECYEYSKSELIEFCVPDERIYQFDFFPTSVELEEEPDNPHDSNAIKVIIDDIHVGYIKKGSCSHVKKLMREDKIFKITAEISGGKYKIIEEDYDVLKDKSTYTIERDSEDFYITIDIVLKNPDDE